MINSSHVYNGGRLFLVFRRFEGHVNIVFIRSWLSLRDGGEQRVVLLLHVEGVEVPGQVGHLGVYRGVEGQGGIVLVKGVSSEMTNYL